MRVAAAWAAAALACVALSPCAALGDGDGDWDDDIVLEPAAAAGASLPEKMLVLIPGGNVPNHHYVATARAIQAAAVELRLWVAIPAVFKRLCIISCAAKVACSPLHQAVEATLAVAAARGWRRSDDSQHTWLAGHSLGGVCANTLFQAYASSEAHNAGPSGSALAYAGLIVMGSYVDEGGNYDLLHYPKPVLTLNAELDGGAARPGKTAVWWRQYLAIAALRGEENAILEKPVIVLPKLNHSDFCPGFDVPGDLPAEADQAAATATVGGAVAAFLHAQTASASAAVRGAALESLRERVAWTAGLLGPYLRAQRMERDEAGTGVSPEGASSFCAEAQRLLGGLSAEDGRRLQVADGFHASSGGLEHCHPDWSGAEDLRPPNLLVHTCSHADYYADLENTGSITAASQVACKMLSSDRLVQQLNTTAAHPAADCRAGNRHAVELALQLAAPSTLERFQRQGRGWCFLEDAETPGDVGPIWIFQSSLRLESNATCMAVSSPMLRTAINGSIYPGSHYCKFLSPARALDWMMTDSLKPAAEIRLEPEAAPIPAEAAASLWV